MTNSPETSALRMQALLIKAVRYAAEARELAANHGHSVEGLRIVRTAHSNAKRAIEDNRMELARIAARKAACARCEGTQSDTYKKAYETAYNELADAYQLADGEEL